MGNKIEKQTLETDARWWSVEKTDYNKIITQINKDEIGKNETEEDKKKAEELLTQIEGEKKEPTTNTTDTEISSKNNTPYLRKDGQQRQKEHPGEANTNRVHAGETLIDEINSPQSNVIAKGLQWIIKKIWF